MNRDDDLTLPPDAPEVTGCVFCAIARGDAPAVVHAGGGPGQRWVIFAPLAPAAPGHVLVVPREHVADACVDPALTAEGMRHAAVYLNGRQGNIITSVGPLATQTVMHLHLHVIPRGLHDGLHGDFPWHRALYDGIRR